MEADLINNDNIYIFGHQNPDTDSVCSAIAYADLKRQLGFSKAKPYRLSEINNETDFVLKSFDIPVPELLQDVKLKIEDLNIYKPVCLRENEPIKTAWDLLGETKGSKIVPIVNDDKRVTGLITFGDLTDIFMTVYGEEIACHHEIIYSNLIHIFGGKELSVSYKYEKVAGSIYIGGNIPDDVKVSDKDIIITANIENAVKAAELNCGAVILTNGVNAEPLSKAKCGVVSVEHSILNTATLINQAISISSVMKTERIINFPLSTSLEDALEVMKTSPHRNFPVIDKDERLVGIISRRHLLDFTPKKVILIDHNERSQSVEGLEQATILEIIDHHRVADIQTDSPLYIRSEPVGSTATIIFRMYRENNVALTRKIAGVLLGAVLSDTLMFSSPTCTKEDRDAAKLLSNVAEVELEVFGREMFEISTSLDGYSIKELLAMDRKRFVFGNITAYISQINTLDFKGISSRVDGLFTAMEKFLSDNSCDVVMLMVTDIVSESSEIWSVGKASDLLVKAFDLTHYEKRIFMPGIVSRKKQVVPKLTQTALAGSLT